MRLLGLPVVLLCDGDRVCIREPTDGLTRPDDPVHACEWPLELLFVGDNVPPVKKAGKLLGTTERWFKEEVVFE